MSPTLNFDVSAANPEFFGLFHGFSGVAYRNSAIAIAINHKIRNIYPGLEKVNYIFSLQRGRHNVSLPDYGLPEGLGMKDAQPLPQVVYSGRGITSFIDLSPDLSFCPSEFSKS